MKTKSWIKYQIHTSIKPLMIFYAILYGIVTLGYVINYIFAETAVFSFGGVEFSSAIYISIIGILGFSESLKMGIQNGFTRKVCFTGSIAIHLLLAAVMSLIDTGVALLIKLYTPSYHSLFMQAYGEKQNLFITWLWLAMFYFLCASAFYFMVLLYNKIGKKVFWFCMAVVGAFCMVLLPVLVYQFLPEEILVRTGEIMTKLMGHMTNGGINFLYPIVTFLVVSLGFSALSFLLIRKAEVKDS